MLLSASGFGGGGGGGGLNLSLNGEMLEEVDHFKYLGPQTGREGGVEVDVSFSFRVGEAKRAAGTIRKLTMKVWEWRLRCCIRRQLQGGSEERWLHLERKEID